MKRFVITEVDKDYNSPTFSVIMGFHSEEEAKRYCKNQEWTGHYYIFEEIKESTEQ